MPALKRIADGTATEEDRALVKAVEEKKHDGGNADAAPVVGPSDRDRQLLGPSDRP